MKVVEITGLTKHWLMECEAKDKFKECTRCKEAVHSSSYEGHVKVNSCHPAAKERGSSSTSRCPLCHTDIQGGDDVSSVGLRTECEYNVDMCIYM